LIRKGKPRCERSVLACKTGKTWVLPAEFAYRRMIAGIQFAARRADLLSTVSSPNS